MKAVLQPRPLTSPRAARTVRVALAGCGEVGGHLLALLREHAAGIAASRSVHVDIVRVLVRDTTRQRMVAVPPHVLTDDIVTFGDTPADIVVEAMGGVDDSARIAHAALSAGRHFITANKALIAAHGAALDALALQRGGRVAFEAAVAGGVPVVRVVRDALLRDDIRAIAGILNGTTNFILSRMERGADFATALADAQARGFAEADPSRDVNGQDAADKIRILAWLATGVSPAALSVQRRGLLPDPDTLVAAAAELDGCVRLIAEAVRLSHGVALSVEPVLVARESGYARTAAADNHVRIETGWTGRITLTGPGAGGAATASALLADLLEHASAPRAEITPVAVSQRVRQAYFGAPESDAIAHSAAPTPAAPTSIADPRPHCWVVALRTATSRALDVLSAAGVGIGDVRQRPSGDTLLVLTQPCERDRIDSALTRLEQAGIPAVRLRNALYEGD